MNLEEHRANVLDLRTLVVKHCTECLQRHWGVQTDYISAMPGPSSHAFLLRPCAAKENSEPSRTMRCRSKGGGVSMRGSSMEDAIKRYCNEGARALLEAWHPCWHGRLAYSVNKVGDRTIKNHAVLICQASCSNSTTPSSHGLIFILGSRCAHCLGGITWE